MKAVIIYDDFDCAAKAGEMLQRAARCAQVGGLWDIRPWRVDLLRLAAASDEALMEAIDADIIVLAGRRVSSMPTWIEKWLENWVEWQKVGDAALAAIGEEIEGEFSPARLSRFAVRHGLRLITGNQALRESEAAAQVHRGTRFSLEVSRKQKTTMGPVMMGVGRMGARGS